MCIAKEKQQNKKDKKENTGHGSELFSISNCSWKKYLESNLNRKKIGDTLIRYD